MRRNNFIAVSAVLLLAPLARADSSAEGERHVEPGVFSYVAPKGWEVATLPGMKFSLTRGPVANQFRPNINVVDEASSLSLDDYQKSASEQIKKVFKNCQIISQDSFKTTDGLAGSRLIVEDEQSNYSLRQRFYVFDLNGTKYVVTCTSLVQDKSLDETFDAAMKTWRFEKK